MKAYYGYDKEHYLDITDEFFKKCLFDSYFFIPKDDNARAKLFGDPFPSIQKHILIIDHFENEYIIPHNKELIINLNSISKQLIIENNPKIWLGTYGQLYTNLEERLNNLQKRLILNYGSFADEYPEQLLALEFINKDSKVLEIGGNIGRNTLIINSILENSKNLVTLESHPIIAQQLQQNLNENNFNSYVEPSALSLAPLIQCGWETKPLDNNIIPEGWHLISTISYDELCTKYNISFDTLVADCEGALYYILKDDPNILNNLNLIIIENDFKDISHKEFVDKLFYEKGFKRIVYKAGGWEPCYDFFFEVWKKE